MRATGASTREEDLVILEVGLLEDNLSTIA